MHMTITPTFRQIQTLAVQELGVRKPTWNCMAVMSESWLWTVGEFLLPYAVLLSTLATLFILTLPSQCSHFNGDEVEEQSFSEADQKSNDQSGYKYFPRFKNDDGRIQPKTTVQVVVLGDIGRSPRMQYHALSIASRGGRVDLVGYVESEVHPDIEASRFINIVPIQPFPKKLQFKNRLLFFFCTAPWKVLWQAWSLYYALGYRTTACKWMLVQNPPSIPTLFVAQWICYFRKTKLVIDWHNFGYTILALRLGKDDAAVRMARRYEGHFSQTATAHFAVTDAMIKVLKSQFNINALALHDRPPALFQPLTSQQRDAFRSKLPSLLSLDPDTEHLRPPPPRNSNLLDPRRRLRPPPRRAAQIQHSQHRRLFPPASPSCDNRQRAAESRLRGRNSRPYCC